LKEGKRKSSTVVPELLGGKKVPFGGVLWWGDIKESSPLREGELSEGDLKSIHEEYQFTKCRKIHDKEKRSVNRYLKTQKIHGWGGNLPGERHRQPSLRGSPG